MTAYLVLASPDAEIPDERSVVIADRFAPLAFIVPVLWLLFHRLWLEALAVVILMAAAVYLADLAGQPLLGLAIDLGLGLYVGLEGRNLRAQALQRRGWRLVDVIEAGDADTAFDIHAARATLPGRQSAPHVTRPSRQLITTGRAAGRQHGSIGLVPVERN